MDRVKRKHTKVGDIFNSLLVIEKLETNILNKNKTTPTFLCLCSCGNKVKVFGYNLTSNTTKSCGCKSADYDLKFGTRFGRLQVLSKVEASKSHKYNCICDCGTEKQILRCSLVAQKTLSCGCFNKEQTTIRNYKHGHSFRGKLSRTWKSWCAMKSRCNDPENSHYEHYGGRGITYDAKWEDFNVFLKDIGERPSIKYTLERVDVNKNYCKENCVWTDDLALQAFNIKLKKNNSSGRSGVNQVKSGKWCARIGFQKESIHLGTFETYEEAVAARTAAEINYYGFSKQ